MRVAFERVEPDPAMRDDHAAILKRQGLAARSTNWPKPSKQSRTVIPLWVGCTALQCSYAFAMHCNATDRVRAYVDRLSSITGVTYGTAPHPAPREGS
jgi:hypothetical protein